MNNRKREVSITIMSNNINHNEEPEEAILEFIRADIDDQLNHDGDVVFDDPWYNLNLEAGYKEEE